MVDLVESDLVIRGQSVVDGHNKSNTSDNAYSQSIFVATLVLIYFEVVNHFPFVQRQILLIGLEADTEFLIFTEQKHAALGEVVHDILEDWMEVLFVLKFVKLYVFIFYDLEVFGFPF